VGVTQPSIHFGKVPRGSVKCKISPKGNKIVSNNTRKVHNWIGSQSNAGANSSIFMLVLEFHLSSISPITQIKLHQYNSISNTSHVLINAAKKVDTSEF
jgi:hypothetical protein